MSDDWNNGLGKGCDLAEKFLEQINAHIKNFDNNKDYIGGFQHGILAAIGANLIFLDGEFFCGNTEDV